MCQETPDDAFPVQVAQMALSGIYSNTSDFHLACICRHTELPTMPAVNEQWTRGAGGGIGMSD